ncbi:hypothetical protein E2320_007167 [Naja naja]|nr:hypothetical protein E2320_007167 [Naja naja]
MQKMKSLVNVLVHIEGRKLPILSESRSNSGLKPPNTQKEFFWFLVIRASLQILSSKLLPPKIPSNSPSGNLCSEDQIHVTGGGAQKLVNSWGHLDTTLQILWQDQCLILGHTSATWCFSILKKRNGVRMPKGSARQPKGQNEGLVDLYRGQIICLPPSFLESKAEHSVLVSVCRILCCLRYIHI